MRRALPKTLASAARAPHAPHVVCHAPCAAHREIPAARYAPRTANHAPHAVHRAPRGRALRVARCALHAVCRAAVRYASRIARRTPCAVQPNARILATKPSSGTLGGHFRPFSSRRKRQPRKNTRSQVLRENTRDQFCARTPIGVQKREDFSHEDRFGPFRRRPPRREGARPSGAARSRPRRSTDRAISDDGCRPDQRP
ncbi:hypothetical protein BN3658_00574 [Coriobacteriaceae bacterium CHKCI002]|nr:hypothetical protein BN3658_00574 [Coriobacteriaceae bacterium CHKCI002]